MRNLSNELDADDVIDECLALVQALRNVDTDERRDDFRDGVANLIGSVRGLAPSEVELDGYLAQLQAGEETDAYQLCDLETGEPLEWSPTCHLTNNAQEENGELQARGLVWKDLTTIKREEGERAKREADERRAEEYARRTMLWNCDRDVLDAYAAKYGRLWKTKLRDSWQTGIYADSDDSQALQALRNHSCFGPSGLIKYKTRSQVHAAQSRKMRKTSAA